MNRGVVRFVVAVVAMVVVIMTIIIAIAAIVVIVVVVIVVVVVVVVVVVSIVSLTVVYISKGWPRVRNGRDGGESTTTEGGGNKDIGTIVLEEQ